MLRKHPAPRTHAAAPGAFHHRGGPSAGGTSHTPRAISRNPVVLVVERDGLLRWALYETLTDAGFRVLAAPTSMAAEAWLHEIDQDLALAIVDDDAWPLASNVRAILATRWPSLPMVVMLHGEHPGLEARIRELGVAEVLVKPFDLPDLVQMAECLTGFPHARTQCQTSAAMQEDMRLR